MAEFMDFDFGMIYKTADGMHFSQGVKRGFAQELAAWLVEL